MLPPFLRKRLNLQYDWQGQSANSLELLWGPTRRMIRLTMRQEWLKVWLNSSDQMRGRAGMDKEIN